MVGAELTTAWRWLDGTSIATSAWDGGSEPVGGNSCGVYDGQKRHLVNDVQRDNNLRYVCTFMP